MHLFWVWPDALNDAERLREEASRDWIQDTRPADAKVGASQYGPALWRNPANELRMSCFVASSSLGLPLASLKRL